MKKKSTFIIAEAGVNHNGSMKRAFQMVDIAKKVGADAIKFQSFMAEKLATKNAPTTKYQKQNTKMLSQIAMLRKLELTQKDQIKICKYCKSKGIEFLSSAFDLNSLDFLSKSKSKSVFKDVRVVGPLPSLMEKK